MARYNNMSYCLLWYEWLAVMSAIAVTCGSVLDASSCLESGVLDCVTRMRRRWRNVKTSVEFEGIG